MDDVTDHERIALDIVNGNLADAREALKSADARLTLDVVFMLALHDETAPSMAHATANAASKLRTIVSTLNRS